MPKVPQLESDATRCEGTQSEGTGPVLCCPSPPLPSLGGPQGISLVSVRLYHFCLLLCSRVLALCVLLQCCYLQCSFPVPSFTCWVGGGGWALPFLKRHLLHSNCCFLPRKHPLQPLKSLNSLLSWSI